jgi:hypothetical protein
VRRSADLSTGVGGGGAKGIGRGRGRVSGGVGVPAIYRPLKVGCGGPAGNGPPAQCCFAESPINGSRQRYSSIFCKCI